ncbi:MAG TPA: twin-arginine translocase subunit TatB [Rhizobiales bacterium]|nr:twin-arginine translocase subunit TatB [Hyphomicrobiales bacterium]
MFDIGWTEMLVIAIVMIVVVGPKDLPKMLRTFGKTTAKLRSMAGDFQKQFNEALKEAELDDVKKSVESLRSLNPANEIKKQLNPFEKAAADVRAGLDKALKPSAPAATAPSTPAAAAPPPAPVVQGPTEMPPPVVVAPEATPPAPAAAAAPAEVGTVAAKPAPAKRAAGAKKPAEDAEAAPGAPAQGKKTGSPA